MDRAQIIEEAMDRQPGATIVFDDRFRITYRNRSARELIPAAEPGADLFEALGPFANPEKIDRMLLREEKVMFPPGPDKPMLEWLVSSHPLSDGQRFIMAWDPDITDEMVQRRATFSMAAAHELKSPLTALIGFTEILEMERANLTPLQEEAAEMIRRNALYLQSLVNDILDLTSNSFGELKLALTWIDIADVISQVTDSLSLKIEERGQKLEVDIEPGLPQIEADSRRIRQVVQNLVQNAHVHTDPETTIRVSAKTRDDGLVVVVEDNGPGLPFDKPEDAFTSFRHAGSVSFENLTGSGIGLTIAKRVTELHRGLISVESEKGRGTKFEVWLPLDRANTLTRVPPGPA
jgi:signal transduction histidine kinase